MDTQNERLRALLAEARTVIHQVIYNDTLQDWACESVEDEPSMEDILRDMRGRIDAALAEPPSPVETEYARLDVMWQTLVRERDEARAEVEQAYRRGAEAMREAAARECWSISDEMASVGGMLSEQGTAQIAATRIRALPIPEDK
jgi:hypothetical protein